MILGRLGCGTLSRTANTAVNLQATAIWLLGIAVFHGTARWLPFLGSALPALLVTWLLAYASRERNDKAQA